MELKVLYFAWLRERVGTAEERLTLPEAIVSLKDLAAWLNARGGGFASVFGNLQSVRVAVNQNFADFDSPISSGDEVAFFPPVTGG